MDLPTAWVPPPEVEPVHFTTLKAISASAAHYRHALDAGRPDKVAMRIGRAAHSIVLGGDEVVVYPGRRAGNEWKDFQAAHSGAEILSTSEHQTVMACVESLRRHDVAMELIEGSRLREHSFSWRRNGFRCEGRADFIAPGRYLGDLKMTRSAQPEKFQRQALGMRYHAQLAWYAEGLRQNGIDVPELFLVAVENVAPHPVTVHRLTARAAEYGDRLCTLWLEQLRGCLEVNRWPGYVESAVELDVEQDLELQFPEDDAEAA